MSIPRPVVYVVNLNLCTVVSNNKTPEKKETYKCHPNDVTGIIWAHFPRGQPPISLSNVYWIKQNLYKVVSIRKKRKNKEKTYCRISVDEVVVRKDDASHGDTSHATCPVGFEKPVTRTLVNPYPYSASYPGSRKRFYASSKLGRSLANAPESLA